MTVRFLVGDVREKLKELPDESVHCVVTSPPYWGLRDYGVAGQLGMEPTPQEHVARMVEIFREVRRVLRKDGVCWVNYGDSYATSPNGRSAAETKAAGNDDRTFRDKPFGTATGGLKAKDLCEIPSRFALAMQQPHYVGKIASEADRVWLAAIIDGEGSIFIHRQPVGTVTGRGRQYQRTVDGFCVGIAVSNCQRAILEKCAGLFGRDNIQHYPAKGGNRRPHFQWRITGNLAKGILQEVYQYLVGKRHEARIAMACPPSGEEAAACWTSLKALHKGHPVDLDFAPPDPKALWEPGWYLRARLPWVKRNAMPESIKDRPATAIEYVFMFTRSERYAYDAEAVRRQLALQINGRNFRNTDLFFDSLTKPHGLIAANNGEPLALDVVPKPFREAHFATFPPKLIEPLIKAGTSEKGCCPHCGAPWRRQTHRQFVPQEDVSAERGVRSEEQTDPSSRWSGSARGTVAVSTLGWEPACQCPSHEPVSCAVLDPFGGSGTTALVAGQLGRDAILIELNPEYIEIARKRLGLVDDPIEAMLA